jgi:hypothetical protein
MEEELRTWKIHVNIRCGIDMPCKEKDEEAILPSTFVG